MSLRTSGGRVLVPSTRSGSNRPRMPSFSKDAILRRSVVSEVPVWRDRSATGLPKTTGGRILSYSTCSGHSRSSSSSAHSSVGSTRLRLAILLPPPSGGASNVLHLLREAPHERAPRRHLFRGPQACHTPKPAASFYPGGVQECVTLLWRGLSSTRYFFFIAALLQRRISLRISRSIQ